MPEALNKARAHPQWSSLNPHPKLNQADVAPGPTVPGTVGLKHAHAFTLFEQMDGGGQTGDPGANDAHINAQFALERGRLGR